MSLRAPAPVESRPLELVEREALQPGAHEILVRVEVCAVCRTDLHVIEGDLALRRPGLVPGHQAVGSVAALGAEVTRFRIGDRVGIAWLRETCGRCRFCARGDENLCISPRFTGWDADGGYAEEALVPADFAHALPARPSASDLAPLLCAGIIGYRAYRRSRIRPGGRLGLWGFGGSAHIAIQVARHFGCEVYVFSRGREHRALARELGAAWVGDSREPPPRPLDAAILFAPAGDLVPPALALGILAERDDDAEARALLRAAYPDEKVRTSRGAYLLALGIARDSDAAELLLDALTAKDAPTRAHAALGLGLIGGERARAALRTVLAAETTPIVRTSAAQALALQHEPADAELLLRELARAKSPLLRAQVAAALGLHGTPEAVHGLLAALAGDTLAGESRAAACAGLAVALSGRDRITLGTVSAGSAHTAFPGWLRELLQQPL
jgi:propanol-preferring alcohol dehydrogenase